MTIVVKEYTSKSGTIYQLKEFSKDRIYHTTEVRSTKASNAEYWDAIAKDKKLEQMQEAESKKVKPYTDDEKFAIAVANKKRQDDERKAAELRHQQQLQQHQEYLSSDVDIADVATTNLFVFLTESAHWLNRNYSIIEQSLNISPTGFCVCQFSKPAASKKK